MKLDGIIIEGDSENIIRIKKAIEKLPEDMVTNINKENGRDYLKAKVNQENDTIIDLQFLEKKGVIYIPERAGVIKHDLESEPGIFFYYQKTPYNILYPK